MQEDSEGRQEGQTLVLVAVVMIVLLAFLALGIDVGHVYRERRQLQNAADAGALAGAYEICFGDPALAATMAEQVARDNYTVEIDDVQVTFPNTYTVDVTVIEDVPTYFAGAVGMRTFEVPATAAAACGAARSACGLWPVAIADWRWQEIDEVDDCAPGDEYGVEFYVWSGDNENDRPDCTVYDCDVNGDGFSDIVDMQSRAWLDFSDQADVMYPDDCVAPGCGADELRCWILNDEGARLELPTCVAGDNGVIAGMANAVDSRIGHQVSIPIYDPDTVCEGEVCPGGNRYWVTSFGCVNVLGWVQSLELPRLDGENPPWKDKAIHVGLSCDACVTYCGGTGGAPPVPGGVNAVSLLK